MCEFVVSFPFDGRCLTAIGRMKKRNRRVLKIFVFSSESFKVHSCAHKRIHDKNDFEVEPTEKQRITMLSDKPVRKSNKENSMCNVTIKTKESHCENHKKHEKKAPKQEKAKHEFLDKLYDMMIKDGFMKARDRNEKVLEFSYPEELKQKIDFDLGSKTSDEKILSLCQDIIKYSVKVGKYSIKEEKNTLMLSVLQYK